MDVEAGETWTYLETGMRLRGLLSWSIELNAEKWPLDTVLSELAEIKQLGFFLDLFVPITVSS